MPAFLRPYAAHFGPLITLGIPIIIGQIGSIVQGLADTIMVGQYSALSLAAASFVNSIMTLVLVAALGYSYGLTPVVGGFHARGEHFEAGQALRASVSINGRMALGTTALMAGLYFLLGHMGQPEELLPEMRMYYLTILVSLPFQMLFNAFKQFSDGVGDTRTPMWILLGSNVLNIVGNWLLIFGPGPLPELGILGAGLATLFSRVVMLTAIFLVFSRSRRFAIYHKGFYEGGTRTDLSRRLHRLGVPLALQMGFETASFSLAAIFQGWIGASSLAAHQVMCSIGTMCFLIYYGIGAATAVRISHFCGLNDWENVRRASVASMLVILAAGALIAGTVVALRHEVSLLFTHDAEVNRIVVSLMFPFVLYQFGDALQTNFANALRGIADVKLLVRYSFISYIVVSLPLSYILAFPCGLDALGIWLAFPVALTTAGVLYYRRFMSQVQKHLIQS